MITVLTLESLKILVDERISWARMAQEDKPENDAAYFRGQCDCLYFARALLVAGVNVDTLRAQLTASRRVPFDKSTAAINYANGWLLTITDITRMTE